MSCEWYANQHKWKLLRGNVMVEGTSDVDYLSLAAGLYFKSSGSHLLGKDFSIFPSGLGDDGGTFGVSEKFPTLFNLASMDLDSAGRGKYRVITLVDNDEMGRKVVTGISKGHRKIIEYESIFRLHRIMPMRAGSSKVLLEKTKDANKEFERLDCVIEDMLSAELCDCFLEKNPSALRRHADIQGSGKHYYLTDVGKRSLLVFAKEYATIEDVKNIIELLKALRSYVGLPEIGVK